MNSDLVLRSLAQLLLLVTIIHTQPHYFHGEEWINAWRQGFNFQCPHGEALVAIKSYFSEEEGSDRLWSFECQPTPATLGEPSACWWDDLNLAGMECKLHFIFGVRTCTSGEQTGESPEMLHEEQLYRNFLNETNATPATMLGHGCPIIKQLLLTFPTVTIYLDNLYFTL
ncbi:dermatopontin isoform X3 [Tachysurus fulvidraco]|uniref:dermatopontin isoform X3 n=1 Tax=Tachysurus fulvidraco TaxID=1234273 RepID=UPI000F4FFBE8|nr:dermatopontin isoform X3 [Tachysurus fulvidraco]